MQDFLPINLITVYKQLKYHHFLCHIQTGYDVPLANVESEAESNEKNFPRKWNDF